MLTKVLLVEDHAMVRSALKLMIESCADYEVVGEAADGKIAMELAANLFPDVMVVDLMIPVISGLELTKRIANSFPEIKILILSMHSDEEYVIDAMKSGAIGYVTKDSTTEELMFALGRVRLGIHHLSPVLSERAINSYVNQYSPTSQAANELTNRELDVLNLVVQGTTNVAIAGLLNISKRTVETHRANLMHKLGAHSAADLTAYAIQSGLLADKTNP